MFKLVLEKAEEPEIKLPISVRTSKKQKSSRKTSIHALLTLPKLLTVWITTNCKILKEMGTSHHLQIIGVPEKEDKKKGPEKILEEIIVESFPKMGKEIATQVQETQSPKQDKPKAKTP